MTSTTLRAALAASTAVAAMAGIATEALAGGFAIREQSAQFQGSSFAGSAAGGGLSSMYWNPAALGQAGAGLTSESHFSGIFGQSQNTVETYTANSPATAAALGVPPGVELPAGAFAPFIGAGSGDIAAPAIVGASYYSYRLSERLVLGMSMNSGFGLTTKPRDLNYLGAELGRTTKLFTLNATPTAAYKVAPGLTIAAGVQIQYADGKLQVATGAPLGPTSQYQGDDFAFGFTAGILYEPTPGTSIGLGYRSQLTHELDGGFRTGGGPIPFVNAKADLDLPDIVTLSIRQSIAPNMRLLGTVEWANWSRFKELTLVSSGAGTVLTPGGVVAIPGGVPFATIDANWSDGWYFALGGEYDLNPGMTLRTGIGYEISPVDSAEKRFTSIPDADRVWLSAGATVKLTDTMTADFAYTHIFIENGDFDRTSLAGNRITGYSESQVDIFSVSLKTKWGAEPVLEPLK